MREYELTIVYDLAVAEAGGPDASVEHLTNLVQARQGTVLKIDHWGRRRMAYPIGRHLDADYVVSRVELDPANVGPLEATLRIDERVFRHLVVRADEIPAPPPPREPRRLPGEAAPAAPAADVTPVAEAPAAPPAEASAAEAPSAPDAATGEADAPQGTTAEETQA